MENTETLGEALPMLYQALIWHGFDLAQENHGQASADFARLTR
jgi:hypothetical protein